jgi:hypothetical protein
MMSQNQDSIKTILEAHAAINRIVNDVKGKYPADVAIVQEQINNPFFNNAKSTAAPTTVVKDQNAAKKASLLRAQSIPSTDTQVDDEIKAAIGSINQAATLDEIKTIVDTFNSKKFLLVAGKQFTVPSAASKRAADITINAINAASDEAGVNAAVATFMSDSNTFKGGQGRVDKAAADKRGELPQSVTNTQPATNNQSSTDKTVVETELLNIIEKDDLTGDELKKMRDYLITFAKLQNINKKGKLGDTPYKNILVKYKVYTTKNKGNLKNIDGVSSNIDSYPRGGEPSEAILLKRFSRMKGGTRKNRNRSSKRSTYRRKRRSTS